MKDAPQLQQAFGRLINAVCNKRLLPFVGAGVSRGAGWDGNPKDKPSTEDLTRRLAKHLCESRKKCPRTRAMLQGALGRSRVTYGRVESLGLPWLAQLFVQVEPAEHVALCEILEIERFAKLKPTPAHRYLAFLAREGLVSEVVTTNYDCCLELAFKESRVSPDQARYHVVQDAESNRGRLGNGPPMLTIYKINGCADCYKEKTPTGAGDDEKAAAARRIALTELDLQLWRDNPWARRLFEDRIAQRSVILTGFGAEEPQVRFTINALSRELQTEGTRVPWHDALHEPNAPFVHGYGAALNQYHQQILHAWLAARAEGWFDLETSVRLDGMQANAFTGRDAGFFRETPPTDRLSADRFWAAVFTAVWRKLLFEEITLQLHKSPIQIV